MRLAALRLVELADEVLFFLVEGLREDDVYLDVLATDLPVGKGDAHVGHLEDGVGLRAGRNVEGIVALDCLDRHAGTEQGIGKGDVDGCIDICSSSFEDLALADLDGNDEVAVGAAVDAGIALLGDTDHVAVIDTLRNVDGDGLADPDTALAVAGRALVLDVLSGSAAIRADTFRLHHAEDRLASRADTTGTMAGRAVDDVLVALGTCAMAIRACLDVVKRDIDLGAVDGLVEGKLDGDLLVGSLAGDIAASCASGSAAEELAEDIVDIAEVRLRKAATESIEAVLEPVGSIVVEGSVAELVILGSLLRVLQDLVGLADFLELFRSVRRMVQIRMVLLRKRPVGVLNLVLGGVFVHTEDFVVVFLFCHLDTSV